MTDKRMSDLTTLITERAKRREGATVTVEEWPSILAAFEAVVLAAARWREDIREGTSGGYDATCAALDTLTARLDKEATTP